MNEERVLCSAYLQTLQKGAIPRTGHKTKANERHSDAKRKEVFLWMCSEDRALRTRFVIEHPFIGAAVHCVIYRKHNEQRIWIGIYCV